MNNEANDKAKPEKKALKANPNNSSCNQKQESDEFEKELEDFFEHRIEHNTPEHLSGCCMTGCHDCPWDYKPTDNPN